MLIHVNPAKITNFLQLESANRIPGIPRHMTARTYKNRRYVGILIHDSSLKIGKKFEECMHIKAMHEHFCKGMDWNETKYINLYNRRYKRVQSQGKRGGGDFKSFEQQKLKPYDKIYKDIARNGFKQSDSIEENIEVALDKDGEILIIDGRHRLFFAQLQGLSEIPVAINLMSESLAKSLIINDGIQAKSTSIPDSLAQSITNNFEFVKQQLQTHEIEDRLKLLKLVEGGVKGKGVLKPPM